MHGPKFRARGAKYRCREHVRGLGRHVCLHSECRAGRPLSPNPASRSIAAGQPFNKACVIGEQQFDVRCRSPNQWDSHIESINELEGEIWNGEQAWTVCRRQPRGSPSNSEVEAEPNGLRPY